MTGKGVNGYASKGRARGKENGAHGSVGEGE